jgi:hypothetical protein
MTAALNPSWSRGYCSLGSALSAADALWSPCAGGGGWAGGDVTGPASGELDAGWQPAKRIAAVRIVKVRTVEFSWPATA